MQSITCDLLELLGQLPLQVLRDVTTCLLGGGVKGPRHPLSLDVVVQSWPLVAELRRGVCGHSEIVPEAVALRVKGTCPKGDGQVGEVPTDVPRSAVDRCPVEEGACRLHETRSEGDGSEGITLTQAAAAQACRQADTPKRVRVINAAGVRQGGDSTQQGSINESGRVLGEPRRYVSQ